MNDSLIAQILILVISALFGIITSFYISSRLGTVLNFRTLVLWNYIVVTIISAITHLTNGSESNVGFYDIRGVDNLDTSNAAIWIATVGLIALSAALVRKLPPRTSAKRLAAIRHQVLHVSRVEKALLTALFLVCIPVGLYSAITIQGHVAEMDETRIVSIDNGLARFSYMSKWLTWGVSALALLILVSVRRRRPLFMGLIGVASVATVAGSLTWSGGRTIVIVMLLPLVLVILPHLRGLRWIFVILGVGILLQYIVTLTGSRAGVSGSFNPAEWADWQWGRFSMIGWAYDQRQSGGFLYGESFAATFETTVSGIARLVGLQGILGDSTSITSLAGSTILGSSASTYVVPGIVAETYLNFGVVGVAFAMYVIGCLTCWVDNRYMSTSSVLAKLTFAFMGSLLIFRTFSADSGALPSHLIYMGAPLLAVAWTFRTLERRAERKTNHSNNYRSVGV